MAIALLALSEAKGLTDWLELDEAKLFALIPILWTSRIHTLKLPCGKLGAVFGWFGRCFVQWMKLLSLHRFYRT